MKKLYPLISLLLTFIILLSMTSCDLFNKDGAKPLNQEKPFVPKTAIELWEKIDRTMDALSSYQCDMKMEMVSFYQGREVRANSTSVFSKIDSKDEYAFMDETETVVEVPSLAKTENTKSLEAFYNGKMYVANKDSSSEQKFVSEVTAEKYRELSNDDLLAMEDIDLTDCTKGEFSQKEDGTWELSLSGYTKKTADAFLKQLEMENEDFGADIYDLKITAKCNEKFRATTLAFELVFDEKATVKPKFNSSSTYSKFNEAKIEVSKINDKDYKLVADVYILDNLEKSFDKYIAAQEGAFVSKIKSRAKIGLTEQEVEETYTVDYGLENAAFFFNIKVNSDDANYSIKYKGGTQTVSYAGETYNSSLTDDEAKEYILSIMGFGEFNKNSVTSIEKQGEGVYSIMLTLGESASFDGLVDPAFEPTVTSSGQEMIVTFSGDKLKKIETIINIGGTIKDGKDQARILVATTYTVVFDNILTSTQQTA